MTERVLEIENLWKEYGKGESKTTALAGVSFSVLEGEFLGIMGSSGSGKTTLLNCISTMIQPTKGRICLKGKDISKLKGSGLANYRGEKIGYLFQGFELLENLTGRENMLMPAAIHGMAKQMEAHLEELADELEVRDLLDKFPEQMSGGQKQRIAAARAVLLTPDILLADEPTGALDSKNAKKLMEKLTDMNFKRNTTIMMVTHDANVARYCSRILFIQDGTIFHELRKKEDENEYSFYERILEIQAQLAGGSANVF